MVLTATLPLTALAFVSAYGLSLSYSTVTRLQAYEKQSEKAAEWSNTVAERLHKTRTTQTGAAITISLSLLTSLTLLGLSKFLPYTALGNVVVLSASRIHMQRFWNQRNQTQVPFVEKFNKAIKGSEELVTVLQWLAIGWAVSGGTWWAMGL